VFAFASHRLMRPGGAARFVIVKKLLKNFY
jgi:hypothetical protein